VIFPVGVLKGIIGRHLTWWMKQDIFDGKGTLTIGYAYPNLNMAEGYNAPGSPYWAFKSFLILALEDNHPYWSVSEEPLPELKSVKLIEEAKMIMQRRKGCSVALTSGQWANFNPAHTYEKYSKFAYSTGHGFSVPRSYADINKAASDSMLTFVVEEMCYIRRKCRVTKLDAEGIRSEWSPVKGIKVTTDLIPVLKGHIRIHRVESEYDCIAYDCGFSIAREDAHTIVEDNYASISNGDLFCTVSSDKGKGLLLNCEANTNLLYSSTLIPAVLYELKKGITEIKTMVEY